ncbi:MAG: hypothetical protein Q7T74_04960 [Candidatus Saccharibacteria bacterium]|nr:hypothetical protein [Candidatus Saccharibacteria bacterium]
MIWKILIVAAIAISLIKLGALSVWVTALSLALKIMLILLTAAVLYFIWQKYKKDGIK